LNTCIKRIVFIFILSAFIFRQGNAQVLDSLLKVLKTQQEDTAKVITLIDVGWEYSYSDVAQTEKYANEALELSEKLNYQEGLAQSYNLIGIAGRNTSEYQKALDNFKKALQIRIQLGDTDKQSKVYVNIANVYIDMGDYAKAERYYKMAIEKARIVHSVKTEITALTNLSVVYQNLGDYGKSLDCLFQSLQLNKQEKDVEQEGFIYVNIGLIYQEQQQYNLSEEYNMRGLELFKKLGREDIVANIYNNLGIVYKGQKKYELALKTYNESMRLYKKIGMEFSATMLLHNIGGVYADMGQYDKALQCYSVALAEALKNEDDYYASRCYMSMADAYVMTGNYKQAQTYAEKGLETAKKVNDKNELKNCYATLSNIFSASKNYEKAFYYQKQVQDLSDSLSNDALNTRLGQMQAMYEADKKQSEIDLLTKDNEIQGEKIIRQRLVNYTVIAGLVFVLGFAFISFRRYREKKRANVEITKQKEIIEEKNKEILDSIHYAKRIQRALLASDNLLKKNLPDHFVFYKPKDIVSGDFYWATEIETRDKKQEARENIQERGASLFLLATCDCTGHGVPGAFMSLLNISKLNETINEKRIVRPDLVFGQVRDEIIRALNPDGTESNARDGMDAVLCSFDFKNSTLQFAAANNPLIIIREGVILEYKADKYPVGMHQGEVRAFNLQTLQLQKNDLVYTFTDGYPDQFGGEKGKKFMSKNFKQMLLSISSLPLASQKEELEKTLSNWKGEFEQVDDVLVIGVRV
jgi:tetratricopeptide (TPR) repeat protein